MVFACGCLDEKMPNWLDAHLQAFAYFGGLTQVIIPDNASTASNQISRGDRARDVNREYRDFLEYHHTAAVPTRSAAPRDKGNVEAGVKVVTNWVIGRLADRRFASLDDLNEAIRIGRINARFTQVQQLWTAVDSFDTPAMQPNPADGEPATLKIYPPLSH